MALPGCRPARPLAKWPISSSMTRAGIPASSSQVEKIWSYQVRPYLAEHWFERPGELDQLDRDVRALIAERS